MIQSKPIKKKLKLKIKKNYYSFYFLKKQKFCNKS